MSIPASRHLYHDSRLSYMYLSSISCGPERVQRSLRIDTIAMVGNPENDQDPQNLVRIRSHPSYEGIYDPANYQNLNARDATVGSEADNKRQAYSNWERY